MPEEKTRPVMENESGESNAAVEAYAIDLGLQAEYLPEVGLRQEELMAKAKELITLYGIKPDFFGEHNRSLIFTALAACSGQENDSFVNNAVYLLSKRFSNKDRAELPVSQGFEIVPEALSDDYYQELYDAYTHQELTQQLNKKIVSEQLFEKVRDRLGLNLDTATPVNLRVLSVGQPFSYINFEGSQDLEEHEIKQWAKGLSLRGDEFAARHPEGELALASAGFAVELNGQAYIFVPQPTAEALMSEESGIVLSEDGKQLKNNAYTTLQHEYVHTQKNLWVESNFGRTLEERRAEYFSGDKREYYDVKRFFTLLKLAKGGDSIKHTFDQEVELRRQGKDLGTYDLLAEQYGLNMLAKIAASQPHVYAYYTKVSAVKEMTEGLGDYESIIRDICRNLSDEEKAAAKLAIDSFMNEIKASKEFLEWYVEPITDAIGYSKT